jgi:hypothetical protein
VRAQAGPKKAPILLADRCLAIGNCGIIQAGLCPKT